MEKYCANLISIPIDDGNDIGRQSPMNFMVPCGYQGRLCPACEVAALEAERDQLRADLAKAEEERDRLAKRFTADVVCICGSTKFKQAWIAENARLTGLGNIVLAVGLWGHHERVFPDAETKAKLDDLHKRKIDLANWVWVLDVGGYIGESTRGEIEYAERIGRPVRYLSKEFPNYVEPKDPVVEERDELRARLASLEKRLNGVTCAEWCEGGEYTPGHPGWSIRRPCTLPPDHSGPCRHDPETYRKAMEG